MTPTDLSLRELRKYTGKTQIEAASLAETTQSELSRLERRDDVRLSTLRRYLDSLGGQLELIVTFGSSSFRLLGGAAAEAEPTPDEVAQAIAALESLGSWLPSLVSALTADQVTRRVEACGTFAIAEHVWHLRDLELEAYGERMRRILAEEAPRLADFDGERIAAERRYREKAIAPALRALLAARRNHVAKLRRLKPAALARMAELEGVGKLSLAGLVLRWRSHDMGHRLEMERLAERLRGR